MKMAMRCGGALLAVLLSLGAQAENYPPPQGAQGPGPGMMGPGAQQRGHGPGMMGPGGQQRGYGPGTMAPGPTPFPGVEFTAEQRKRIQALMDEGRQAHQQRMQKMQQYQQALQKLYLQDRWDAKAIGKLYEKMHAEQRKTIEEMAEARNKVYDMMTREQREQMRRFRQQQMERFTNPPQQPYTQPPQYPPQQ